jgi:hypothetical protein
MYSTRISAPPVEEMLFTETQKPHVNPEENCSMK